MVDIRGLDKADVLAALYNASKPQGMGFAHYDPKPMTKEDAQAILDAGHTYFDYLKGRVMKIAIDNDSELDPRLYDRDNGNGAAYRAIEELRKNGSNSETIQKIHEDGRTQAAIDAKAAIEEEQKNPEELADGTVVFHLGISDQRDNLMPNIEKILGKKPTTISAKRIDEIINDCLFRDDEIENGVPKIDAIMVESVKVKMGFHPERLKTYRQEVMSFLMLLPKQFRRSGEGGWSFLNACMTEKGEQWGEHKDIDMLLALGLGLGLVEFVMPRDLWSAFPGGMPYFVILD